jgi:hypothetical protein
MWGYEIKRDNEAKNLRIKRDRRYEAKSLRSEREKGIWD